MNVYVPESFAAGLYERFGTVPISVPRAGGATIENVSAVWSTSVAVSATATAAALAPSTSVLRPGTTGIVSGSASG